MKSCLEIIARSDTRLSQGALEDLERQLEALAALWEKGGRGADRLALICVSALTAVELTSEAVQDLLDYLTGGPGWTAVRDCLTAARYAAQVLLQKLAGRELLSPELLAAVLDRLSPPGAEPDEVRRALAAFLRQYDKGGTQGSLRLTFTPPPAAPAQPRVVPVSLAGIGGGAGRCGSGFGSRRLSGFGSARRSGLGSGFGSARRSGFGSGLGSSLGSGVLLLEDGGGYGLGLIAPPPEEDDSWAERLLRSLESPRAR